MTVQFAPATQELPIAAGTVMPLMGSGYAVFRQQGANTWVLQRYPDGQPAGPETTVTAAMGPADSSPGVMALTGGGYAMTWLRQVLFERFGGSLYEVVTQSFTPAGVATGSPQAIGQTIPGRYWISRPFALPQSAALAAGGHVVVWALPSHADSGVYARRFNGDGTPAGAMQQVTPHGGGYLGVTGLSTGGYMVTWGIEGGEGYARAYSSSDVPLGPARHTGSSYLPFGNHHPACLSALPGGGAVMAWLRSESGASSTGYVHLVQLAPDATRLGPPGTVDGSTAPSPGHGSAPAVAGLADGGYVVAWVESGEVHARRFAAGGTPQGGEIRVNLLTTAVEQPLAVAAMAGGGFMISWSGVGTDGVRSNYARVFSTSDLVGTP